MGLKLVKRGFFEVGNIQWPFLGWQDLGGTFLRVLQ